MRGPDPVLASVRVVGGVQHAAGGELGLVDRWHRLGVVGQAGQHPGELGGVDRGHLHHGDVHVALVVQQFAAQRLVETLDGVFGAAVRGLQRDAAVGQRGADLHDRAPVAGLHVLQRGHGAVDVAEVADLGHAPVLVGGDLVERGEHGGERDVDPHVDRAECRPRRGRRPRTPGPGRPRRRRSRARCRRPARPARRHRRGPSAPRATSTTVSPRAPNAIALARPIPPLEPVTTMMRGIADQLLITSSLSRPCGCSGRPAHRPQVGVGGLAAGSGELL